jgi:hypothetical protein
MCSGGHRGRESKPIRAAAARLNEPVVRIPAGGEPQPVAGLVDMIGPAELAEWRQT